MSLAKMTPAPVVETLTTCSWKVAPMRLGRYVLQRFRTES